MSQQSHKELSEEESQSPPSQSPTKEDEQSVLALTFENGLVKTSLEQQFSYALPLSCSNHTVEGKVEITQQCSNNNLETRSNAICNDDNDQKDHALFDASMCTRDTSVGSSCANEYIELHDFDGKVVIRKCTNTQTDWAWVEKEKLDNDNLCRKSGHSPSDVSDPAVEFRSLSRVPATDLYPESLSKHSELDKSLDNEVWNMLSKDPQTPTACQVDSQRSPTNLDTSTSSSSSDSSMESSNDATSQPCEYCQLPRKPPVTEDILATYADQSELFCCEVTWEIAKLRHGDNVAVMQYNRTIEQQPVKSKKISLAAEKPNLGSQLNQEEENMPNTICYRLSNEVWTAKDETSLPEMEIDSPDTLKLHGEDQGQKRKGTLIKLYNNGQTFITIFPDGTGQIYYPSGRLAVIISAVNTVYFSYVILEDRDLLPNIQATFNTKGQATCYHENGLIWVNLTQLGGSCSTDTGAMKMRWSWLDHNPHPHIHVPPFRTLCLALNPNITISIQSQDCIHLTFTAGKNSVQLNVGTRFQLDPAKGLMLPCPDMVQRHLQLKRAEIDVLLEKIQSYMTYQQSHALSPSKLKSQYSLISQMERLRTQLEKQYGKMAGALDFVTKAL